MVTILKGYNQLQNVILTYNKLVKLVTVMLFVILSNDQQLLWRLSQLIPELLEFFCSRMFLLCNHVCKVLFRSLVRDMQYSNLNLL